MRSLIVPVIWTHTHTHLLGVTPKIGVLGQGWQPPQGLGGPACVVRVAGECACACVWKGVYPRRQRGPVVHTVAPAGRLNFGLHLGWVHVINDTLMLVL